MFKFCINSSTAIHDVGTSKRICIYNKRMKNTQDYIRVFYGPIQYCIPIEKHYYNVFTGERVMNADSVRRSTRRARCAIIDLAKLNSFEYFGTLTIDSEKHNVHDVIGTTDKLKKALHSYSILSPNFKYLVVPEYGEKNHRLHYHFLFKGVRAEDLFKNEHGKLDFKYFKKRFGFVQITKIKQNRADVERVAIYCGKYISKDNIQINSHRYFRSKNLVTVTHHTNTNAMVALYIRKFLDLYQDDTCYYNGRCICYDVPLPLYEKLKENVVLRFLQYCAHHHISPMDKLHLYELP